MQTSLSSKRAERIARCEDFFAARITGAVPSGPFRERSRAVHDTLLASAITATDVELPARAPAIAADGTPLFYSLKIGAKPEFRMAVEPGSLLLGVPEQIAVSLDTARAAIDLLGWRSVYADLHELLDAFLPDDLSATAQWWGGVWTGFAASATSIDLRLYVNLRNGDLESRWNRLRTLFSIHGDELAQANLARIERAAAAGMGEPAGVCLVIADGRIAGLRLYVTLRLPSIDCVVASMPPSLHRAEGAVRDFCRAFTAQFGAFGEGTVSVGYDFAYGERAIEGPVRRFKAELSCQRLDPIEQRAIWPWLADVVEDAGYARAEVEGFYRDLESVFGGAVPQYASIGVREQIDHFTVYAQPLCLATVRRKESS